MTSYKRFENESEEELILRVCEDKDKIGTWAEVADILNELLGNEYTESKYRKTYQSFKKMLAANQAKFSDSNEQLQEINEAIRELEIKKIQMRDERNEYKRLIREQARKESYKDQIIRAVREYQETPLEYDYNKKFNGVIKSDNSMIISFFDVHTGLNTLNFANEFNEKVLKDRINQYLDKIFEVMVRHGTEDCYVILSELVNGIIHPTLRIENNQNLIEQFLTIMSYLTEFLVELSYRFNEVNVYTVLSNHGRITPNKEESLTGENMDLLAIPFLSAKLQNFNNIKFHENIVEKSIALFTVRNSVIASAHGDKDNPDTVVQKFTMFLKVKPNIIYLGHRHTNGLSTVYDTKVIQSGSMAGVDNYCLDKRLRNRPEQTISIITDKGLDCLYNVVFD